MPVFDLAKDPTTIHHGRQQYPCLLQLLMQFRSQECKGSPVTLHEAYFNIFNTLRICGDLSFADAAVTSCPRKGVMDRDLAGLTEHAYGHLSEIS